METAVEGCNPGVTDGINSPTRFDQSLAQRREKDKCFNCKKFGHWVTDCPLKTPKKASTADEDIRFLPLMRCYCGVAYGIRSSDSSGRMYYERTRCKCTDVEPNNANQRVLWCSENKAPLCTCGAGFCTINMSKGGNEDPFIYYTCRIRTGHGACDFLHVVKAPNSPSLTTMRRSVEKDRQPSVLSSKHNGTPNIITHEGECSDFSNRSIDTLEVETNDPLSGKQLRVSRLMSRFDVHIRQMEFWNQISDADDSGDESKVQNLSHHVDGWMGRLAFPPPRFLADPPPKNLFCCIFSMLDANSISALVDGCNTRSSRILPDACSNAKVDEMLLNTASSDNQLLNSRTSSLERSFMQEEVTSLIIKNGNKHQKGLLIQSMDAPDHDIQLTSSAAQIQLIVQDNCNTEAPAEHENIQKCVDKTAEALTFLTASNNNLLSARQRTSHLKDRLLQIDRQLQRCQTESWKLETLLRDIFKDVGPSNKRMQAAYQALTEEEMCFSPSEFYSLDTPKRQKIVHDDYGQ